MAAKSLPTMNPALPLELLRAGESAEVAEVFGEPAWVGRMAELGLRVGTRLQVLQAGSPCLLQVNGSRLCLRAEQAMQILVRLVATEPAPAPALQPALEHA
jgi:Fe2+ transport system protein FeoA